jgi:predicted membrane protein
MDLVKITCYGKMETMERKDAIAKYLEAMAWSDGSERDRYVNIYLGLISGEMEVSDD